MEPDLDYESTTYKWLYRHLYRIYEHAVLRDELKVYETEPVDTVEA